MDITGNTLQIPHSFSNNNIKIIIHDLIIIQIHHNPKSNAV